jgi:hypothetical protein
MIRLTAGALSLGAGEIKQRLDAAPHRPAASQLTRGRRSPESGKITVGHLLTGIASVFAGRISGVGTTVTEAGHRSGAVIRFVARIPLVAPLSGPARRRLARYRSLARELSETGRQEEQAGRRMVEQLIRDTTATSVRGITESALKEVTHSPEVAALVRTESAGIATGAILEVRANSEQADDRLERSVHSWLRLRGGGPDAAGAGTPPPTATDAGR